MTVDKSVDTTKSDKKKREVVTFDLGPLKKPWVQYCKRNKLTPSQVFKQIVRKLTGVGEGKKVFAVQEESLPDVSKKIRMTLRWTESEMAAIEQMAEGHSSPNFWVIDAVRAKLTNTPQFGMNEVEALWESCGQLMKIGTNLNQIARAINMNPHETELARFELLEEIRLEIRSHTAKVANLLNANLKRWDIK